MKIEMDEKKLNIISRPEVFGFGENVSFVVRLCSIK